MILLSIMSHNQFLAYIGIMIGIGGGKNSQSRCVPGRGGGVIVGGKEVREGMNRGRNRKTDKGRKGGRKEDQEGERRMKTIARL